MKFAPRVLPELPCSRASLPLGSLASWRAKRVCIERAQHLMLTTSATLSEIAVTCGLSDHSHMTRLFRRIVDASSAEWRKHNRQDPQLDRMSSVRCQRETHEIRRHRPS
jgi:AraC-like DNA-binding protein